MGIFKKDIQNNLPENRIIGVIGLGKGVGVTHLCIMTANFLTGVHRKKVAVLEWYGRRKTDETGDICRSRRQGLRQMEKVCTQTAGGKDSYQVMEVDYYPEAGTEELLSCMNQNYQHIILDFGDMGEHNRTEFFRCDEKLVIVSLSEWQISAFWDFYQRTGKAEHKGWNYLTAFGSEETRIEINKKLKLSIERIPLSVDAFAITGEIIPWFSQMLQQK